MTITIFQCGKTYHVNEKNEISYTHTDGTFCAPSSGWLLLGAVEQRVVFGRLCTVRRYTVEDIRANRVPWLHENGTQRCFIVDLDLDHGTRRM
jgi:hypothetical protein